MSLFFSIREGIANFRRARFAAFASTMAMAVALLMLGTLALLGAEAQQVLSWLQQRVGEMEVFVAESATDDEAQALFSRIQTHPQVESAEYISKEDAQAIFQEEFGEGAESFIDEPFLPASVRLQVRPSYVQTDSLAQLQADLQTWDHVDEVVFNQPLLNTVQQNIQLAGSIAAAVGGIVLIAALFLVGNTIRLTIYARRLLIRTMKLVGATDGFIRRPFLVEGALQGMLAGALAGGGLWALYRGATSYFPQLAGLSPHIEWILLGGTIGTGLLLGWIGSFIAVRRFINRVEIH
ncbi:MAG: permease-like cell division protein FtsX [Longimonas sp.]|uniref:cell division protein FtsX n=1 Tax=Longimonas sp. TaxID=2039626 RepID=UPI003975965E